MSFSTAMPVSILLLLICLICPFPGTVGKTHDKAVAIDTRSSFLLHEKYTLLGEPELNPDAFKIGIQGYISLRSTGLVKNDSLLTIIDFSRPSSADRFFVINMYSNTLVCKSLVAHGRNSGDLFASRFSNRIQSYQSSLGFYITGGSYQGGQGYSLILNGVDTGYNDLSRARSIVIHGADYATQNYVGRYGRLGRSFGCPALPPDISKSVINLIKDGTILFSYYPDRSYLHNSVILHPQHKKMGKDSI
jgi:hypothetical protein